MTSFCPRDATRKRGLCCRKTAGWLARCLSHAGIVSKWAKPILKLFLPSDNPVILVFLPLGPSPNSKGTPSAVALNTRGWENWQFSTEITVYLGNGAR